MINFLTNYRYQESSKSERASFYHLSQFDYYEDAITKQDWNETELTEDDISESVYEDDLTADDKFKSQMENKVFQNSNSNKNKRSPTKPKENNTRSAEVDKKR